MVAGDATGWLADAQGFLSLAFPAPLEGLPDVAAGALPGLGTTVTVAGRAFRVTDIKDAVCIGAEGELPFAAPAGRAATYLHTVDSAGGFAGIESSADGIELFLGHYTRFDALGLRNLRPIDGWAAPGTPPGADDPLA